MPAGILVRRGADIPSDAMPGRLGVFQRAMLSWNETHPYNAVHVALVPARLEPARLEALANELIGLTGLTGLVLDRRRRRFFCKGGPARIGLRVLAGGHPAAALQAEIQSQINSPFHTDEAFTPFRLFAVPAGDAFYVGLVYCHFISDANPIAAILCSIAAAYRDRRNVEIAVAACNDTRRSLLPLILKRALRFAVSAPGFVRRLSHAIKPRYSVQLGHANGFAFFKMPAEEFGAVGRAAHRWGVTVNDVFLAALLKAVAPHAAARQKGRRRLIAVSSIASIRKDLPADAARKLAPFLGTFTVFHPLPSGEALEMVARAVHLQTSPIKQNRLYLRTLVELAVADFVMRCASERWREKFYRQNYPIWGGVASLNLDALSCGDSGPVSGYLRAVSTGPVCPLVVSATTYGGALQVGISYRRAVYSSEAAEGVVSGFRHCLAESALY